MDSIIFSLIKSNKEKFHIDENYCPNKIFLEKILEKIENYSKNILSKDDVEKIIYSKDFINKQITKNETKIDFHISCSEKI